MATKSPTNSDLLREIQNLSRTVLQIDGRVGAIEHRHELIDIGKEAVQNYKKQEAEQRRNSVRDGIAGLQLKAWHLVVGILAIISAIIYAIAATRGIRP